MKSSPDEDTEEDLLNTSSIYYLHASEFSDGIPAFRPQLTFDEDFIRQKYLTPRFLIRLWRTHFHPHLQSTGTTGHALGAFWQHRFHPDTFSRQSKVGWKQTLLTARHPLHVVFHVPLSPADRRFHHFMMVAGRALEQRLLRAGCLLRTEDVLRLSLLVGSSRKRKVAHDEDSDVSIDIEGITDDEVQDGMAVKQEQVLASPGLEDELSLLPNPFGRSVIPPCAPLTPETTTDDESDMENGKEDAETFRLRNLILEPDDPVLLPPYSVVKLAEMPAGYQLYDRLEVTYPPPPPFFQSIRKPPLYRKRRNEQDDDDDEAAATSHGVVVEELSPAHERPQIKIQRSFCIYGHPRGSPLDVDGFVEHVWWLYNAAAGKTSSTSRCEESLDSDEEDEDELAVEQEADTSTMTPCQCALCPYPPKQSMQGHRPGDLVWVHLGALFNDRGLAVDYRIVDVALRLGMAWWAALVVEKKQQDDAEQVRYGVKLVAFLSVFRRVRPGPLLAGSMDHRMDASILYTQSDFVRGYVQGTRGACVFSEYGHDADDVDDEPRTAMDTCFDILFLDAHLKMKQTVEEMVSKCCPLNDHNGQDPTARLESVLFGSEVISVNDLVRLASTACDFFPYDNETESLLLSVHGIRHDRSDPDSLLFLGDIWKLIYKSPDEHRDQNYTVEKVEVDMAIAWRHIAGRFTIDRPFDESAIPVQHVISTDGMHFSSCHFSLGAESPAMAEERRLKVQASRSQLADYLDDYSNHTIDRIPVLLNPAAVSATALVHEVPAPVSTPPPLPPTPCTSPEAETDSRQGPTVPFKRRRKSQVEAFLLTAAAEQPSLPQRRHSSRRRS